MVDCWGNNHGIVNLYKVKLPLVLHCEYNHVQVQVEWHLLRWASQEQVCLIEQGKRNTGIIDQLLLVVAAFLVVANGLPMPKVWSLHFHFNKYLPQRNGLWTGCVIDGLSLVNHYQPLVHPQLVVLVVGVLISYGITKPTPCRPSLTSGSPSLMVSSVLYYPFCTSDIVWNRCRMQLSRKNEGCLMTTTG